MVQRYRAKREHAEVSAVHLRVAGFDYKAWERKQNEMTSVLSLAPRQSAVAASLAVWLTAVHR